MIQWDKRDFKKMFPALSEEIDHARAAAEYEKGAEDVEPLRGFMPRPEDYIMRCSTEEEAIRVIDFLRVRGEITEEESASLKKQVGEKGVRSFGPLREDGYYLRTYLRRRGGEERGQQASGEE
ncbi:MAG: DUF2095 family protein [Nitrososphaerota archaeon]|nr:DUF2095 family protein [Candidatus Calditenuaceae archaeon]MDW8073240.1 DUF2095 family protein [Nitrososphaerota archaeon]